MSFEPRDFLRHILVEADYLIEHGASLSFSFIMVTAGQSPSAGAALSRRVVLRAVHLEHPVDPAPAH